MNAEPEENHFSSSTVPPGALGSKLEIAYPFDWSGIEDFSEYRFTAENLPLVYLGKQLGWRFYPITVAQWGLYRLQQFAADEDESPLRDALAAADWLVANAKPWNDGGLAWIHDWPLEFYGTPAPWISAMAQGEGVSLLLRAHQLTGESKYFQTAVGAFRTFETRSVCSHFPDGKLSLEEYPANPPSHVLNGAVFASLGLFDFATYTNDLAARELWEKAIHGLMANLHRYDTGFWTRYDLFPVVRLASQDYHEIHIRQMRLLHRLTGEVIFAQYEHKWIRYQKSLRSRVLWLLCKILEKLRLALRTLKRAREVRR